MLKVNVVFGILLIGVEGTKTPAGVRGRGDPGESEVPGAKVNRLV